MQNFQLNHGKPIDLPRHSPWCNYRVSRRIVHTSGLSVHMTSIWVRPGVVHPPLPTTVRPASCPVVRPCNKSATLVMSRQPCLQRDALHVRLPWPPHHGRKATGLLADRVALTVHKAGGHQHCVLCILKIYYYLEQLPKLRIKFPQQVIRGGLRTTRFSHLADRLRLGDMVLIRPYICPRDSI